MLVRVLGEPLVEEWHLSDGREVVHGLLRNLDQTVVVTPSCHEPHWLRESELSDDIPGEVVEPFIHLAGRVLFVAVDEFFFESLAEVIDCVVNQGFRVSRL